jgi:hypothetical protein
MIYTFALWGLFLGFAAQDNPVKILDLTEVESVDPDRMFFPGIFEVGIPSYYDGPIHSLPAMSLEVNLDKASYVIGEEFTYKIRLKNISEIDIRIPLYLDGTKIIPPGDKMTPRELGLVEIYASLRIDETDKRDMELYGNRHHSPLSRIMMYGSDKIDSSIITLNPNESIEIKYKGRWTTEDQIFLEEDAKDKVVLHVSADWRYNSGFYRTLNDVPYDYKTKSEPIQIELIIPSKEEKAKEEKTKEEK